jgi:hypothetical protein
LDDNDDVGVFPGPDALKRAQHSNSPTPTGTKIFDKWLSVREPKPRAVLDKHAPKLGAVPVIMDRPAPIGAPPLAVARDTDCEVACLPDPSRHQIADPYPGEAARVDAEDATVLADAARSQHQHQHVLPRARRKPTHDITAVHTVPVGFDQDLAAGFTQPSSRIHGLLTWFHPSHDQVLGPGWSTARDLPERHGAPAALREADRCRMVEVWSGGLPRPKASRRPHQH